LSSSSQELGARSSEETFAANEAATDVSRRLPPQPALAPPSRVGSSCAAARDRADDLVADGPISCSQYLQKNRRWHHNIEPMLIRKVVKRLCFATRREIRPDVRIKNHAHLCEDGRAAERTHHPVSTLRTARLNSGDVLDDVMRVGRKPCPRTPRCFSTAPVLLRRALSLPTLPSLLADADLGGVEMLIEFRLPLSSKRTFDVS
jgi:hypothetical protein